MKRRTRPQAPSLRAIRRRLLAWFDLSRRDLPWRRPAARNNPYRIWLAEIMLQQTRTPVVIPFYDRFLRAFPTIEHLARARPDRLLRLWAGLGYYNRARNLHRAAKQIVAKHGGKFPTDLREALTLPGVGDYSARAILSIAYRQPVAVVDGNVARVLARLFALAQADVRNRASFQPLADRLLSRARPGDFNQAVMELGATVCLPRIPRCPECPLQKACLARAHGLERKIPRRAPKKQRPQVELSLLVIRRRGRWLLVREPNGYFSGLWHFPYARGRRLGGLARAFGAHRPKRRGRFTHQTTMRDLLLTVYTAESNGAAQPIKETSRWVEQGKVEGLGVGSATRKAVRALAGSARTGPVVE